MSNWSLREIKAELTRRGVTFAQLDREASLTNGTSRKAAAGTKIPAAEQAIAAALSKPVWEVFPQNWTSDGIRIDRRFRDHTSPHSDFYDS